MNKNNQGKVWFICGCFDLFHAGHVAMLREAKTVCDFDMEYHSNKHSHRFSTSDLRERIESSKTHLMK